MCGYDDHTLPPVRGGGNQGYHTASHWAVMSTLVAHCSTETQRARVSIVDVSAHAAANVTTEVGTYGYLAIGNQVLHARPAVTPVERAQPADAVRCAPTGAT